MREIQLLGTPKVESDDGDVPRFRSQRTIALLGYLAAERRTITRERLAALFWPDDQPQKAKANLRRELHNLGQILPGSWDMDRVKVCFTPTAETSIDLDLVRQYEEAAQWQAAADLLRGDFLEGIAVDDNLEFETWLLGEQERWRQRAETILTRVIDLHIQRAEHAGALDYARKLLKLTPWNETIHRQVMLLLARTGQRGAALRQYALCREILDEELGVEPSAETTTLYEQIKRNQTFALHNVPAALTPLLGRNHDLAAVRNQLSRPDVRLVTIIGPPGVGKTRLSIAVAGELAPTFAHGAAFVELAPIDDVNLVPDAVGRAFGIKESGDLTITEGLKVYLNQNQMLLVLDNFEHLLPAAPWVAELLQACPRVKVLATSRAALEIRGESRYPLLPLLLPDLSQLPPADELIRYPSIALFVARAEAVEPAFRLTQENAAAVAGICLRLDGLPLAIELAAARIGLLTPSQLQARLDEGLSLLAAGPRDVHDRQQTLRAAINWSYELLDDGQQRLLFRLAVFSGGCTLAAAEGIISDEIGANNVLDGIALLKNNSLLVRRQPAQGRPRFFMLETIREFAKEKLFESGDEAAVRQRHAEYFVTLAEKAEPELRWADQAMWLARLEREHDNFRAALSWLMEHDEARGLHLSATLAHFWHVHGHYSEGREWLAKFMAAPGLKNSHQQTYAKALNGAGELAWYQGDHQQALNLQKESVQLWRALEQEDGLAYAMRNLAMATNMAGDLASARSAISTSVALFRKVGDLSGLIDALFWQGFFAYLAEDYEPARLIAAESLELAERIGDVTGIAAANSILGHVAYDQADYATARPFYETSLAYFKQAGDLYGIIVLLGSLMNVSYSLSDYKRARIYIDERLQIARRIGHRIHSVESLYSLGLTCTLLNQNRQAHRYFDEALLACSGLKEDRAWLAAESLTGLALLLASERCAEQGAQLLGAVERHSSEVEGALDTVFQDAYERALTATREQLNPEEYAELRAAGKAMTVDQALEYGLKVNSELALKNSL